MRETCQQFRDAWEHGEPVVPGHLDSCAPCQAWCASLERRQAALRSLARLEAPVELEARVARELSGNRSERLERVLGSLVRRGAPAALDARMAEWIGTPVAPPSAEALRALDVQRAPQVLERLLREELEKPELHRAERFSGSLARLHAPEALAERLGDRIKRRALLRLVVGPLTALAAAGLVLWLSLRSNAGEGHAYRFQVQHATSLDELDPTARSLAEALGGGVRR